MTNELPKKGMFVLEISRLNAVSRSKEIHYRMGYIPVSVEAFDSCE